MQAGGYFIHVLVVDVYAWANDRIGLALQLYRAFEIKERDGLQDTVY